MSFKWSCLIVRRRIDAVIRVPEWAKVYDLQKGELVVREDSDNVIRIEHGGSRLRLSESYTKFSHYEAEREAEKLGIAWRQQ